MLILVASILTLGVISCDRFFGVVFAMKARITGRRPSLLIAGVWVAAVAVSSPLLVYRRQITREWLNHTEVWCADNWPPVSWQLPRFQFNDFFAHQLSQYIFSLMSCTKNAVARLRIWFMNTVNCSNHSAVMSAQRQLFC